MEKIFEKIGKYFDHERWKKLSESIYSIERKFCYRDFEKSADLCRRELEKSGAKQTSIVSLKADGEQAYGDFIMPRAWDFEYARLEIFKPEEFKGKILADTSIHPFHIANRSRDINEDIFEVIDIKKISKNSRLDGCFVFCGNIHPRECRHEIEKTGATGIISSFSKAPDIKDGLFWINGWVKNSGWYHTKQDRQMVCFSITPADGEFLQNLLDASQVKVKVSVRSRTYDGHIYSITGLIPGKTNREICFLAHLYEPMLTDNATGVAGLIELCRVFNSLIENNEFMPEISIRFLFSMERYGMMEFFERKHNVIYAFNVDSIADDIVKTEKMHYTLYGSPLVIPFFGDWILERILTAFFKYPWKKEMPAYEDDTFVSDSSIGIPSGYLVSHPGKLHHNSYLSQTVNWEQGKHVLNILGVYFFMLSSGIRKKYLPVLEMSARSEFFSYIANLASRLASMENLDSHGIKRRIDYFAEYIKKKYLSARSFGIGCRENFLLEIDGIAKKSIKEINSKFPELRENIQIFSSEDKKATNILITRRKKVFIFSLADIPHSERIHPPEGFHHIINRIDGKKDLHQIFEEICFEKELYNLAPIDENEKRCFRKYIEFLAKYGYLGFKYKTVVSKQEIKKTLRRLGINRGDKIIVHSSLSSIGYVIGGAETVCKALMELIGPQGILMMPSFNHGVIFTNQQQGACFSPLETETINGSIPATFWKMKNVYRSLNPTHSFAAWGKNAREFVKNHHKVLTMGKGSPLELLEKSGGKIVMIGTVNSNTFHHVIEMTNNVPCLGKRTEQYPVKLPSGEIVKIRTWSWRDGVCEITDNLAYMKYMLARNLIKKGKLGNADVFVIDMKICRKVVEKFLKGRIKGYPGCKTCKIKPRKTIWTVESDWDEKNNTTIKNTTAFVDDYEPVCF